MILYLLMPRLYRLSNFPAPLVLEPVDLRSKVAVAVRLPAAKLLNLQVVKRSVDARKKSNIRYVLQVEFSLEEPFTRLPTNVVAVERSALDIPAPDMPQASASADPVVVVGAGPAGLFAALALSRSGRKTILIERGKAVDARMLDIGALRAKGQLDPESNICFGEGGAGAYTDGKLYTRIKHPYARWVLRALVDAGAPPDILIDAHPHLGTEKLVAIVRRLREQIQAAGGEVRFATRLAGLELKEGRLTGVRLAGGETLAASGVVLAIGHSARDTIAQLLKEGLKIEAKPFAVGLRAEHPQELVNRSQYGVPEHAQLGAAAYALTHQAAGGRGVYSFCMCPGGFIVPSPTEPGHMAVNGMSNSNRSTPFANSGIVVQIEPKDLIANGFSEGPLIGIAFQRELEKATYKAVGQSYNAPAMRVDDFLKGQASGQLASTHFRPAAIACDVQEIVPDWVLAPLKEGVQAFARRIRGFDSREGNLFAVESRTSAPLRMTRGDDMAALGLRGVYPAGEGAGYAGGIVSAAVDGLRAAQALLEAQS
jgi:uncharacterized FAD-dependent dehydrogenase